MTGGVSLQRRSGASALGLVVLGTVVALSGCNNPPQDQPTTQGYADATQPAPGQSLAPDETLAAARTIDAPFGKVRIEEVGQTDAAHVEGGRLAVTYLATGKSYPDAVKGGSFGGFGDWSVDDRFSAYPMIVSIAGGTGQGYTCTTTELTELRPEGPIKVAAFKSHFDNGGVPGRKPEATDGKIVAVARDKGFTVQFTGTQAFTAVYTRKGNSYEQQGQPRTLEGC